MQYDVTTHPADMKLYRTKFATEKQRAIWSEENIISKRLLVEPTLAEAQAGFSGPALDRWPLLAQVLLLSNEFLYVD